MLASRREDPHAAGTGAVHPAFRIDFHAIRHPVLGGGHATEHATVAQGAVGRHVISLDELVLLDLAVPVLVGPFSKLAGVGRVQHRLVGRESDAVGEIDVVGAYVNGTVRRNSVNGTGPLDLLLGFRNPAARVGKVDAAVAATDDVVGAVEALAVPSISHHVDGAVRLHARDAPVVALAHEQATLKVQGHAIGAAAGLANDVGRPASGGHSMDHGGLAPQIYEQPVAVGVPQRPLSEHEIGGELLGFLVGFHDTWQIFGHDLPPVGEGEFTWIYRMDGIQIVRNAGLRSSGNL